MPTASSNLLGDMGTVITTGPTAATTTKAIANAGPIMDYVGCCKLVVTKLQEAVELLGLSGIPKGIITDTDSTDSTNLAKLTAVSNALTGGSSPSTTLVTDMGAVITAGPNSATTVKANANAGPIMDYAGCCRLVLTKLQECAQLLSLSGIPKGIITVTDAGDGSLGTLQNVATALT